MSKELFRRIHSELLDVLKSVNELEIHHDGDHFHELLCDVETALADQEFIFHDEENEGGWSDWVCPKPDSYLMKCCDCGLVHEMQTRVAKYEPKPSDTFVVPNDPDLQTQFRMRRHEILKTTPPQRTWVGLTDGEYQNILKQTEGCGHLAFYNLVESKLREKNYGSAAG
jgi:hypothetical protein